MSKTKKQEPSSQDQVTILKEYFARKDIQDFIQLKEGSAKASGAKRMLDYLSVEELPSELQKIAKEFDEDAQAVRVKLHLKNEQDFQTFLPKVTRNQEPIPRKISAFNSKLSQAIMSEYYEDGKLKKSILNIFRENEPYHKEDGSGLFDEFTDIQVSKYFYDAITIPLNHATMNVALEKYSQNNDEIYKGTWTGLASGKLLAMSQNHEDNYLKTVNEAGMTKEEKINQKEMFDDINKTIAHLNKQIARLEKIDGDIQPKHVGTHLDFIKSTITKIQLIRNKVDPSKTLLTGDDRYNENVMVDINKKINTIIDKYNTNVERYEFQKGLFKLASFINMNYPKNTAGKDTLLNLFKNSYTALNSIDSEKTTKQAIVDESAAIKTQLDKIEQNLNNKDTRGFFSKIKDGFHRLVAKIFGKEVNFKKLSRYSRTKAYLAKHRNSFFKPKVEPVAKQAPGKENKVGKAPSEEQNKDTKPHI